MYARTASAPRVPAASEGRANRSGRVPTRRGADANPLLGQKVRHPNYGVGTIVGVEGDDEDRKLAVSFPGRGTKKFVERYAQLEQM